MSFGIAAIFSAAAWPDKFTEVVTKGSPACWMISLNQLWGIRMPRVAWPLFTCASMAFLFFKFRIKEYGPGSFSFSVQRLAGVMVQLFSIHWKDGTITSKGFAGRFLMAIILSTALPLVASAPKQSVRGIDKNLPRFYFVYIEQSVT